MTDLKEIAKIWDGIVEIYKETIPQNNPKVTVSAIYKKFGKAKANEAFATIAEIKKHDGRISQRNRKRLSSIQVNPDCTVWDRMINPMIGTDLDYIHTAHIKTLQFVIDDVDVLSTSFEDIEDNDEYEDESW